MRKIAFPVIALAALGIVSLFLSSPTGSLWAKYSEFDPWRPGIAIVGFGLALSAAIVALVGDRVRPWQGFAVLGGFAMVLIKFRAWRILQAFDIMTFPAKLLVIAIVGGVICGLFAVMLPRAEEDAVTS